MGSRIRRSGTPEQQATGDDAVAAGMALVPGTGNASDLDLYDNQTRDYIANGHTRWKPSLAPLPLTKGGTGATSAASARTALGLGTVATQNTVPIANGGTGATTAGAARTSLDAPSNAEAVLWARDVAPANGSSPNKVPRYSADNQLTTSTPSLSGHAANKQYVDSKAGSGLADGPTSAAYNRGTTGTSYFAVWMNAQLQFMRNTSSRRFKKNIRDWTGGVLGLRPVIFDRRGKDGATGEVGFIAEEVLEVLPEAVVYFDGQVDGINDRVIVAALVAEVQRLAARVAALEQNAT